MFYYYSVHSPDKVSNPVGAKNNYKWDNTESVLFYF